MIYILGPANVATGGTELLHQLGYKLNLLGIPSCMYYLNRTEGKDPVCKRFKFYNVPYVDKLEGSKENIVIIPEIYIPHIVELEIFRCAIWWLSVDNAIYQPSDIDYIRQHPEITHLVQSQYALDFLNNTIHISDNVFYLSDYINGAFFRGEGRKDTIRTNTVLFNPSKGRVKTFELISNSDYRIHWQALAGLAPDGMRDVMRQAKVYIDFGNHPGKDRIPREAAVSGCCIVTNKQGSAGNDIDVPIPGQYKFDENSDPKEALECICRLLDQYDTRKEDYYDYVKKISNEYIEFEKDVAVIFGKMTESVLPEFSSGDEYLQKILHEIEDENYSEALKILISYRVQGYEESLEIDVIETAIRIGLGEYPEAELCANRGLKKEPENYELYMDLAQVCYLSGRMEESREYSHLAVEYSSGTDDEETVKQICSNFLQ